MLTLTQSLTTGGTLLCPNATSSTFAYTCRWAYTNFTALHGSNSSIVLFTDGDYPEFDNTFPVIDDSPIQVAMWLMTLSDIHYGAVESTVDFVVSHWRKGKDTRPSVCFSKSTGFNTNISDPLHEQVMKANAFTYYAQDQGDPSTGVTNEMEREIYGVK